MMAETEPGRLRIDFFAQLVGSRHGIHKILRTLPAIAARPLGSVTDHRGSRIVDMWDGPLYGPCEWLGDWSEFERFWKTLTARHRTVTIRLTIGVGLEQWPILRRLEETAPVLDELRPAEMSRPFVLSVTCHRGIWDEESWSTDEDDVRALLFECETAGESAAADDLEWQLREAIMRDTEEWPETDDGLGTIRNAGATGYPPQNAVADAWETNQRVELDPIEYTHLEWADQRPFEESAFEQRMECEAEQMAERNAMGHDHSVWFDNPSPSAEPSDEETRDDWTGPDDLPF